MKKSLASALIFGGACALTASANAATTILVNDTFTGGTGADTATYPRWSGDGVTDLTYTSPSDDFNIKLNGTSTQDRTFARSFGTVTLGANESLTLTFDMTVKAAGIYRFGLFDFTPDTLADNFGTVSSTKDGYYVMFGNGSFGSALRKDTSVTGTGTIMGGSNPVVTSVATASTFTNTLVSVVFKLTNTGTALAPSILVEGSLHTGAGGTGGIIGSYNLSGTQPSGVHYNTFDTIGFLDGGTDMLIDNVKLAYTTTAVPEPGTYAAGMGGLVAFAALALRRKRRS